MFRGQSVSTWPVTSTLYRAFSKSDKKRSLSCLEKSVLAEAQYRTWPHTPKLEAFAELQHMGGMSNYIDFTRNIHVAVYYACAHNPQEDGAVYFLKYDELPILYPFEFGSALCKEIGIATSEHDSDLKVSVPGVNPVNFIRVIMQDSVFMHAKAGYIDSGRFSKIEPIKAKDKQAALEHVRKQALVSGKDLFGDIAALAEQDRLLEQGCKPKGYMQLKLNQYDDLKKEAERWKPPVTDSPYSQHPLVKVLMNYGRPYYRQGRISYSRGNYNEARNNFLEALDKGCGDPVQSKVHVNLASTYLYLEQYQDALKCLNETNHYSYEEVCHFMAAEAHFRMGNYQEAWDRIGKAVDMNRCKLTYLRLKAAVAFKLGWFAKAQKCAGIYLSHMYDRQIIILSHKAGEAERAGANSS